MVAATEIPSVSKAKFWAGRIITTLMVLFLFFDSGSKILKLAAVMDGTTRVGYPASLVQPIGVVLLVCTILYMIPRTSVLGAILLTGYLGGATATMVRVQDALFLFPAGFGMLAWLGLFLREPRLWGLVPLRTETTSPSPHEQTEAA